MEVGKDENAWVETAWTWIRENVRPGDRVFLPAGGTPRPLFRRFREEASKDPYGSLLRQLTYLQLDEILSGPKAGLFRRFFEEELPSLRERFEWISTAEACADLAVLGVGVNGHVAFHEPGLPREFFGGCVRLTGETLGYLDLTVPTWGLTYGVATFVKARKILVLAQGESKRRILQQALTQRNLPISWILEHPDVTLVTNFEI
jgi:6-phosphogluconolactonase/glucosamine-6-phosphate isomerase/deaminase